MNSHFHVPISVELVTFNVSLYRDNVIPGKTSFEDGRLYIVYPAL